MWKDLRLSTGDIALSFEREGYPVTAEQVRVITREMEKQDERRRVENHQECAIGPQGSDDSGCGEL